MDKSAWHDHIQLRSPCELNCAFAELFAPLQPRSQMELRRIFQAEGRLVMGLGGTSVGKTFLTKKLQAELVCDLRAAREDKIKAVVYLADMGRENLQVRRRPGFSASTWG